MSGRLDLFVCGICTLLVILSAGCVAPPKDVPASPQLTPDPGLIPQSTPSVTPTLPLYVTIVTPYEETPPTTRPQMTTLPTLIGDDYILIYGGVQYYAYNKTAIAFDLKNPPMMINFTVKTYNVSGTQIVRSRSGGGDTKEDTVSYSYYNPAAFYEVTIRNRTNGAIIMQDGFQHGFDANPDNRTMKVLNRGDFLIEMGGNNVTASINISVKKEGNIVPFTRNPSTASCAFSFAILFSDARLPRWCNCISCFIKR
jgi:hypothetical protein